MKKTLYYNGPIITMEEDCSKPDGRGYLKDAGVLVQDGRITFCGPLSQALKEAGNNTDLFDLQGHTLLPAFLDAHSHFTSYANSLLQISLDECSSIQELKERIKTYIRDKKIPKGKCLTGRGYDHNQLREHRHPTKEELDMVSPENPLVISHQSGHMGVFNSAALRLFHITENTPAPAGGTIEKKNGVLTGYLEENAFMDYLQKLPSASFEEFLEAFRVAQKRYASYGISTVQEGMVVPSMIPFLKALQKEKLLQLDLVAYPMAQAADGILPEFKEEIKTYNDHLKIGGLKIFLDGSPQGRTAWMREPYLPENNEENFSDSEKMPACPADNSDSASEKENYGYRGYNTLSDEEVYTLCKKAVTKNLQILAHCNGDAACGQYLNAFQKLKEEGYNIASIRPIIVHAQLIGKDQLERASSLGLIPSFFVAHTYYWGDTHIRNFGLERASRISPAREALELGMPFTFHQDSPVIEPDMLKTIWCAVNRRTRNGITLGIEQSVSVLDALKAVTINAAHQYFEEKEKGSIRKGKSADFVILDKNPLEVSPEELDRIRVLTTIKEDQILFDARI